MELSLPAPFQSLGEMENSWPLNEVILKMNHAGVDQNVVYPVQGVTLPTCVCTLAVIPNL